MRFLNSRIEKKNKKETKTPPTTTFQIKKWQEASVELINPSTNENYKCRTKKNKIKIYTKCIII